MGVTGRCDEGVAIDGFLVRDRVTIPLNVVLVVEIGVLVLPSSHSTIARFSHADLEVGSGVFIIEDGITGLVRRGTVGDLEVGSGVFIVEGGIIVLGRGAIGENLFNPATGDVVPFSL